MFTGILPSMAPSISSSTPNQRRAPLAADHLVPPMIMPFSGPAHWTAAERVETDALGDWVETSPPTNDRKPKGSFADSIYNRLAALLACFLAGLVLIIVRRLTGDIGSVVLSRRCVVERSRGWFGRWRRLSKDHEAVLEVFEGMVASAVIRLMLRRLAHPNRRRMPTL
jgi:putative transposase